MIIDEVAAVVVIDVWSDSFVLSHFNGKQDHHSSLYAPVEVTCSVVIRRYLELKKKIIDLVQYCTSRHIKIYHNASEYTDEVVAGMSEKLSKDTPQPGVLYFVGFHADECILKAMNKMSSTCILLAEYSDTIHHFSLTNEEHSRIYNDYLISEFPFPVLYGVTR